MERNCYIVLGVTRDASPDEIKAAYRQLAKQLHPDYYGEDASPFMEVQRAYAVLSDEERRRAHDHALRWVPVRRSSPLQPVEPVGADPLTPGEGFFGPPREPDATEDLGPISLRRSFRTYGPSFEELFAHLARSFEDRAPPKAEVPRGVDVVVTITPEQARRGGQARVLIPARTACPTCRGRGEVGLLPCWRCDERGVVTEEVPVPVSYPAGLLGTHSTRLSLERLGIRNAYLTVHFRVSDEA